jgi:hypothetical protein
VGWDKLQTRQELNDGGLFDYSRDPRPGEILIGGDQKRVGFLADPSDGEIRCNSKSDIKSLFEKLGKTPKDFLVDAGIYKLNSDGNAYELVNEADAPERIKRAISEQYGINFGGMNDAMKYANALEAFNKECRDSRDAGGVKVWYIDRQGNGTDAQVGFALKGGNNDNINLGYGYAEGKQSFNCREIVGFMNQYYQAYADEMKRLVSAGVDTGDDSTTGDAPETCENQNNNIIINWILCPMLGAIDSTLASLMRTVEDLLYVDPAQFQQEELKVIWAYFRIISTVMLVIAGLVMVISQAIGVGPFDAYTIKKVFPRIVVGVIGIQLSWYLFTELNSIVNNIAWGIEGLMYAPFGGSDNFNVSSILGKEATGFFLGAGGALATGLFGLGLMGTLSLGLTALIGIAIAFALLSIRQFILIALFVLSPIAIAAWILPNTDKMWKIWWESYSKLLLMYPFVIFFVAAGRVFAYIVSGARPDSNDGWISTMLEGSGQILMMVVGLFGPFFLIPKTFQLAGSAFANIAGVANNRGRGVFDRLKNYRGKKMAENWQKTRSGNRFAGGTENNLRGKFNRGLEYASNVNQAGLNPVRMRSKMQAALGGQEMLEMAENLEKNESYQSWKGNDTLNKYAAKYGSDIGELRRQMSDARDKDGKYVFYDGYSDKERKAKIEQDVSRVEATRRSMSSGAFKQMTTLQAVAGGTAYGSAGEMAAAIAEATGGDEAATANMVAKARSAAMGAGRIDQGGAGFGKTLEAVQKIGKGDWSVDQATKEIHKNIVANQGPGSLLHSSMKTSSIEQLAPQIKENLAEKMQAVSQASNDTQRAAATDAYKRELAKVAGAYDAMAQTSPAQAEVFAKEVMGQGISFLPGTPSITIRELVDNSRNDDAFLTMRREYSSAAQHADNKAKVIADQTPPGQMPANPGQNPFK